MKLTRWLVLGALLDGEPALLKSIDGGTVGDSSVAKLKIDKVSLD